MDVEENLNIEIEIEDESSAIIVEPVTFPLVDPETATIIWHYLVNKYKTDEVSLPHPHECRSNALGEYQVIWYKNPNDGRRIVLDIFEGDLSVSFEVTTITQGFMDCKTFSTYSALLFFIHYQQRLIQ